MAYAIQNPRIDWHNHFWITTDKGNLGPDRFKRNLDTIVASMEKAGMGICALTNSQDTRYEQVVSGISQTELAKKSQIDVYGNCVIVDGKRVVFRGEELHTDRGDLVLAGAERTFWKPKSPIPLQEAVKIGKGEGAFILAPHPYSSHGGIGDHIEEICQDIDAVEINPNCTVIIPGLIDKRGDNKKAIEFAEGKKIPIIWTSDSHWPDETGRGFFEIAGELEFKNGRDALQRIKDAVKNRHYKSKGRLATPYEIARLIAVTIYDLDIRRPLGLVQSTFEGNF